MSKVKWFIVCLIKSRSYWKFVKNKNIQIFYNKFDLTYLLCEPLLFLFIKREYRVKSYFMTVPQDSYSRKVMAAACSNCSGLGTSFCLLQFKAAVLLYVHAFNQFSLVALLRLQLLQMQNSHYLGLKED